jgi:beta-glucosidase
VSDILDLPNMLDYDIRHGRTYMYAKAKPLYPFGYGLSYTSFKYSKMKVSKDGDKYIVRFNLKNTGSRDGEEVVQLYAQFKGDDASKRLRGFERVAVKAGETVPVELVIPADDLKLWDADSHSWAFRGKRVKLMLGASSADTRLKKNVKL